MAERPLGYANASLPSTARPIPVARFSTDFHPPRSMEVSVSSYCVYGSCCPFGANLKRRLGLGGLDAGRRRDAEASRDESDRSDHLVSFVASVALIGHGCGTDTDGR